jgi:hypothetical protein
MIETLGFRQFHLLDGASTRLDFPDDLQLLTESVILDRGETDQVLGILSESRPGETATYVGDNVAPLPYDRKLSLLGY